jgi:kynurenine formamidase
MIIDFTHTIVNGMAVYPGSPSPVIEELENYDYQGVHVQKITMEGHTGTHIDAPSHLFPDGRTADLMEISAYYGTAQFIDCSKKSGA